jgi:hypothetical protein
MMLTGIELKDDADFDYALHYKRQVEVKVWGEVDYRGGLIGYSRDAFQVTSGDWYIRGLVEVKTI